LHGDGWGFLSKRELLEAFKNQEMYNIEELKKSYPNNEKSFYKALQNLMKEGLIKKMCYRGKTVYILKEDE
jgi:predicted transcriptional regulator